MPDLKSTAPNDFNSLFQRIRSTSSDLADACQYLGSAMRTSFVRMYAAQQAGDTVAAASLFADLRDSEIVQSISAKFHHLRDDGARLWRELSPFAQTVFGLTMVVAGALLIGKAGILAVLLIIGGFLIALDGLGAIQSDVPLTQAA